MGKDRSQTASINCLQLMCVCTIILLSRVESGQCQFLCFNTATFACHGDAIENLPTNECCESGYLSFSEQGQETCTICPNNVQCFSSLTCNTTTEGFLGLGAMTRDSCCTNEVGGIGYVPTSGKCKLCDARPTSAPTTTTEVTTVTTATEATTVTTTTVATTSSIDISIPSINVAGGDEQTGSGITVGAIVGAVIGALLLVGIITTITIIVIVVLVIKK